ncbi:hypothetical protein ACRC6Q_16565 [Planococcus sp. SE5232]
MIEAGEPLYYYIATVFITSISFMAGTQFGSVSKKGQKNSD